ncbi:MAG TPA: phage tail sheath subtilisin-like domain-containing protein [Fimbriimonadaceae bacterium]|nr:phage tail sheath subtilisin-like domain-containing protein [Fimbriimonadaceae bacterium]
MGEYLAPGVFVEEIDSGSKPIEGVGVNMAAFVGFAKSGKFNEPVFISNWGDFCREFGEDDDIVVPALCEEVGLPATHLLQMKRESRKSLAEFANEQIVANYHRHEKNGTEEGKSKNWNDFVRARGLKLTGSPFSDDSYLAYAVRGYYDNGGGRAYIVRVAREQDLNVYNYKPQSKALGGGVPASVSIDGYTFKALNPGVAGNSVSVEIVPLGDEDSNGFQLNVSGGTGSDEKFGSVRDPLTPANIAERIRSRKISVEVATGVAERPTVGTFSLNGGLDESNSSLDRVLLDEEIENVKQNMMQFEGDESKRTGVRGLTMIDDLNMIMVPDLMAGLYHRTSLNGSIGQEVLNRPELAKRRSTILGVQKLLVDYCERMGDRMCILDPLPDLSPQEVKNVVLNEAQFSSDHGQGTIYYPWVKVIDQTVKGKNGERYQKFVPPCGHIAGVWCRVAVERGVHKAPANESLMGVTGLQKEITKGEQEILNPNGINCIRSFPGTGIRVWGARTLATVGNPSWKYVNVRRLFNYLERSMDRGLQWVVFEPNDHDLWGRVRRNLSAFLFTCWKEGMLFGQTPDQAYYVKCDEETNPQEMIDLGRLYVEIGVNPVKPAEFVIVRIGQWSGGGETNEN